MTAPAKSQAYLLWLLQHGPSGTVDICQSGEPGAEHAAQLFCARSVCPSKSSKAQPDQFIQTRTCQFGVPSYLEESLVEQRRFA